MYTREYLMDELHKRVCRVIFKKVNGEERDMMCTLMPSELPSTTKNNSITEKKVREVNPEVIAAWDINKQAFRSFRVDNIISFS